MKIKKHIKRIVSVSLWSAACIAMLIMLGAAVKAKNVSRCEGYKIDIKGATDGQWFVDKKDILNHLGESRDNPIKGRLISSFDLNYLERKLRKDVWIKDADIYLDNNNILRISITERIPVARVFTTQGNSFYIDTAGIVLPLSGRMPARVPVFTGFPYPGLNNKLDSSLISGVSRISSFILQNEFWMAQIQQVAILPGEKFELYPMIGDHVIEFGTHHDYELKFRRLMIFYKNVLSKTGFDKYSIIKTQFDGQIVGVRRDGLASEASASNQASTPQESIISENDSAAGIEPVHKTETTTKKSTTAKTVTKKIKPATDRPKQSAGSGQKNKKIPKAVMPEQQ